MNKRWHWYLILMLAISAIASTAGFAGGAESPAYDIVIRNGRVLDGNGNPWVRADVAIRNGRFVKVGVVDRRGKTEIDASGKFVSPGWIDMMDQSEETLARNGLAENKVLQGVTTLICGEAGTHKPAGQTGQYLASLAAQGISPNFGTYYAAAQAREAVMGDAAGEPTALQLQHMKDEVDVAMRQGALGLTTALIYPPSSFQSTAELTELARVAARFGGVYASHVRGEGAEALTAISEAIEIGEKAGLPVEVFHLKVAHRRAWGKLMPKIGELIDAARKRGVDVAADMYPYTGAGTGLDATVPSWVFSEGTQKGIERLRDPQIRARLKVEVNGAPSAGWWNIVEATGGWGNVVLGAAYDDKYAAYQGQSIEAIAQALGKDAPDVAWDILLGALPQRASALYFMMSEEDVETALQFPWVSIGSDGGVAEKPGTLALDLPHPRAYGTFPRIIAEYVRARPVLSLAEAVRKMSSWPASRMRLFDRGSIREGLWADVVIFDYPTLQDRATWKSPAEYPSGIDYVIVNGHIVAAHGKHTGARSGKILYGPGWDGVTRKSRQ